MSNAITQGIRVQVRSEYVADRSDPDQNYYFFAYHVKVSNEGDQIVQLVSRHWIITNAEGKTEEVQGPGVIGEQPVLKPGDSFEYTSFCPLDTPMGTMHGTYQMLTESGGQFDVEIAPFTLAFEKIVFH